MDQSIDSSEGEGMMKAPRKGHISVLKTLLIGTLLAGSLLAVGSAPALADPAAFGTLFYNGGTIHTVVVSAPLPNGGQDPFYKVTNGAAGQLGIAGAAPGSGNYHGGAWAVSLVTFKSGVTPYLLTSAQAVQNALNAGDVTVTRTPANDFRCPVQP
jgi:hypothetical protein